MRLTEEHQAIRHTVRQFVEKELNPYCDQWEEEGIFPAHEVFRKMGKLGLLGIAKPTEYGGMGLDYSYQVKGDGSAGMTPLDAKTQKDALDQVKTIDENSTAWKIFSSETTTASAATKGMNWEYRSTGPITSRHGCSTSTRQPIPPKLTGA